MRTILIALLIAFSLPANASSMRFQCEFQSYASPSGLKKVSDKFALEFTYDTITGEAMLVGNNGLAKVQAFAGSNGVTFLEFLGTGVVQSTTISGERDAVHSRNTIIGGDLAPSQYYGTCK